MAVCSFSHLQRAPFLPAGVFIVLILPLHFSSPDVSPAPCTEPVIVVEDSSVGSNVDDLDLSQGQPVSWGSFLPSRPNLVRDCCDEVCLAPAQSTSDFLCLFCGLYREPFSQRADACLPGVIV